MGLVDPKVFELAEHFMEDELVAGHPKFKSSVQKLADAIQDAIEDWFEHDRQRV